MVVRQPGRLEKPRAERYTANFENGRNAYVQDYLPPPDTGLDVIYEDDTLLVIDKPSGLLSVPGRGPDKQDSLLLRVRARYADAECVHRLDMETSGLMLLARGKSAQRALGRLFEQRRIAKGYIALVDGRLMQSAGEIHLPLICDWPNRPRQKVDHRHGKPSSTRFHVLRHERRRDATRVSLQPLTGRSHQLRVHMQSLGHSILGDSLYAPPPAAGRAARLLLHASELAFRHPANGTHRHFCSPAPF